MNKKQKFDDLVSQASALYEELMQRWALSKKGYEGKYFTIGNHAIFRCNTVVHATNKIIEMQGVLINTELGVINSKDNLIYQHNITPMFELNDKEGKVEFEKALDAVLDKIKKQHT